MTPKQLCALGIIISAWSAVSGDGTCKAGKDGTCSAPLSGDFSDPHAGQSHASEEDSEYLSPQLLDISVPISAGLPVFMSASGLDPAFKSLASDMDKGGDYYATSVTLNVHTGTHVDAPSHYLKDEFKAGNTVDKFDLETLIGPAYAVNVPDDVNITAKVLEGLHLPEHVERVLFITANTRRNLMHQKAFASDYTGFTADGAQYLVDKTHVKVAGIDYLSIASSDHQIQAHQILLRKGIIPVEGLDLRAVHPGHWYHLTCLPLNIPGAEGSPTRCVLYGPDHHHDTDHWEAAQEAHHEEGGHETLGSEDEL